MNHNVGVKYLIGAITVSVWVGSFAAYGQQSGNQLIAVLDATKNFGTTRRSVVFYDPTVSMDQPLFSVFVGFEATGNFEDPGSITINPLTGDIYVLAYDSGADGNVLGGDTEGDFDLYRIDTWKVFNHWSLNAGGAERLYYNPDAPFQSPYYPGGAFNPTALSGCILKIGEIARNQGGDFFDSSLEFVDEETLLLLDNQTGTSDVAEDDHVIRAIKRVSKLPGSATYYGSGRPGAGVDEPEGGFNEGTSETWESYVIGYFWGDFAENPPGSGIFVPTGVSEAVDMAYAKEGDVEGVWKLESDFFSQATPVNGDDVSFFQITNYMGTSGNFERGFWVGSGPDYPVSFALDNDPTSGSCPNAGPCANDGDGDWIIADQSPGRNRILIGESGYWDDFEDLNNDTFDDDGILHQTFEPKVVMRHIDTYDDGSTDGPGNAGLIDFGAWETTAPIDLVGPPALYDDDTFVTDGRVATYNWVDDYVLYGDIDSGGTPNVIADVYSLDMASPYATAVLPDGANGPNHFLESQGIQFHLTTQHPCDFNDDGEVDLATDIDYIDTCNAGPAVAATPAGAYPGGCDDADIDGDGDVDSDDFGICQRSISVGDVDGAASSSPLYPFVP
jgi:hypothetical protein